MKCYRKNGSDLAGGLVQDSVTVPSMKCYRKNGSDQELARPTFWEEDPQ